MIQLKRMILVSACLMMFVINVTQAAAGDWATKNNLAFCRNCKHWDKDCAHAQYIYDLAKATSSSGVSAIETLYGNSIWEYCNPAVHKSRFDGLTTDTTLITGTAATTGYFVCFSVTFGGSTESGCAEGRTEPTLINAYLNALGYVDGTDAVLTCGATAVTGGTCTPSTAVTDAVFVNDVYTAAA